MGLDLAHAFGTMFQQALEKFRVQRPRPRFQRHLILEGADLGRPARLVPDIDRRVGPARSFHRTGNAAQRVEIMVDGGHAQLDRFQILIGDFHIRQRALQKLWVRRRFTIHPVSKAFAVFISIGQLILVPKCRAIHQLVHVRPIGPFRVGKDAQTGGFDVTPLRLGIGQRMGADKVPVQRLVGCRTFQCGLGQHTRLQWQQVTEDPREGHDHVDARAAKLFQRDQVGTTEPSKAVEPRHAAHQRQRLGNRPTIGFDIVRPPKHQRNRARQSRVRVQQQFGLFHPIAAGEGRGHAEGVKGVDVAARGENVGRPDQIAAGHWRNKLGIQRVHEGA
mmetsp:Transcript_23767/g.42676  ORF Transcript_23767/g.42676 Transcript_23767/m.42676 type:complete len:333 (+) Transcript_23767:2924-3922(+)